METHEESITSCRSALRVGNIIVDEGVQMGEMSRLSWLIGLVKHTVWVDSLYFLYLLLISISKS
jgi:hypothetical protein